MMSLAEAAAGLGSRGGDGSAAFTGGSTDTRSLQRGDLFVALRGERFDGHAFLDHAKSAGAAGALVDRGYAGKAPLAVITVADTKRALGDLARHWRARFSPTLIPITGSTAKPTAKEMPAA